MGIGFLRRERIIRDHRLLLGIEQRLVILELAFIEHLCVTADDSACRRRRACRLTLGHFIVRLLGILRDLGVMLGTRKTINSYKRSWISSKRLVRNLLNRLETTDKILQFYSHFDSFLVLCFPLVACADGL